MAVLKASAVIEAQFPKSAEGQFMRQFQHSPPPFFAGIRRIIKNIPENALNISPRQPNEIQLIRTKAGGGFFQCK